MRNDLFYLMIVNLFLGLLAWSRLVENYREGRYKLAILFGAVIGIILGLMFAMIVETVSDYSLKKEDDKVVFPQQIFVNRN